MAVWATLAAGRIAAAAATRANLAMLKRVTIRSLPLREAWTVRRRAVREYPEIMGVGSRPGPDPACTRTREC